MDVRLFSRERSTPAFTAARPVPYYWAGMDPPAGEYDGSSFPFRSPLKYCLIKDTPHSRSHGTFGWKYPPGQCYHAVYDPTRMTPLSGLYVTSDDPVNYPGVTYHGQALPPLDFSSVTPIVPSISDEDFYSLNREAFNYFSDVFPPQMSFSEFIVGTRELTALLPQIQDSISKSFSGGYLNKEFGWDNLLSDLGTLSQLLDRCRERLRFLKSIYGVPTRLGFSRPHLSNVTHSIGEYVVYREGNFWIETRCTLRSFRVDYRATAKILQTLDYLDGTVGLIRSVIGALGLNNPIKAIWVNLPFSFVIDWFVHISDHLDTLTRAEPATGWDITNVSCSVKSTAEFDVTTNVRLDLGGGTHVYTPHSNGTYRVDIYRRIVSLPLSLVDLLPTSELSPTQLTLLMALLHQQG